MDQDRAVALTAESHEISVAEGRRRPGRSPGQGWVEARRDVVKRFGRLPFRNEQLGRESTPEEKAFLRSWTRGMA